MTRQKLICFALYTAPAKAQQFSFILVNFLTIELWPLSPDILFKSDGKFLLTCFIGQVTHLANSPNGDRKLIFPHMADQNSIK